MVFLLNSLYRKSYYPSYESNNIAVYNLFGFKACA
jgi:hypothetical protein